MGRTPRVTYLWPGLAQIWHRGAWSGLAMAAGFAILLNLAMMASFVWVELVSWEVCAAAWIAVTVVWGGWAVLGLGWGGENVEERSAVAANDLFREAQDQYLQRNWFEAERVLSGLLRNDARDVEARLMRAAVLRRTGRLDEATEELDQLERMEASEPWHWEIARERGAIAQALTELDTMHEGERRQDAGAKEPRLSEKRRAA